MGRPKEFDPDRSVAEAMDVVWAQGHSATSPQQSADRLRIGKGSLYNAFGGKRQLFDLALRHYLDLRVEGLRYWLEGTGPAKGRLREALLFFVKGDPDEFDRRGCLATNGAVEFGRLDEAVATQVPGLFDQAEVHVHRLSTGASARATSAATSTRRRWRACCSTPSPDSTSCRASSPDPTA